MELDSEKRVEESAARMFDAWERASKYILLKGKNEALKLRVRELEAELRLEQINHELLKINLGGP